MVFVLSLHAQVVYAVFSMREFSAPLLPPAATGAAPCHDHDQVHSALPLQVLIRVQATGYSYQSRRDSGLWAFSQVKPLQLLTQLDSSSPHDTLDAHYKVNPVPDPVLPLESSRPPGNSRPPSPSRSPSPRPKPQPWTPSSSSPAAHLSSPRGRAGTRSQGAQETPTPTPAGAGRGSSRRPEAAGLPGAGGSSSRHSGAIVSTPRRGRA